MRCELSGLLKTECAHCQGHLLEEEKVDEFYQSPIARAARKTTHHIISDRPR